MGISPNTLNRYPDELSGSQRQRIGIVCWTPMTRVIHDEVLSIRE